MKKIISAALTACLALALLGSFAVSAANDEVLIGTPTIDGVIDDIYKESLTIVYDGNQENNVESDMWWGATATFYALYDDKYVYLVADVKDDDVVSAADSFVLSNGNPYKNDCIEFRLDFNNSGATGADYFKVGIDGLGKRIYTLQAGIMDVTKCVYKTALTNDGYVIEVAVPHSINEKTNILDAGVLGFKAWFFDLKGEAEGVEAPVHGQDFCGYSLSFEGEGSGDRVFYTLSDEKAADKIADKAKQDQAPTTFDPALIAVVLTAASGAAFVVASKKR